MQTYLITARLLHFTAVMSVFGIALFALYGGGAAWRLLAGQNLRAWLFGSAVVSGLSALLWWDAAAATMSGKLSGARDPQLLRTILLSTAFGRIWLLRLVLAVALAMILSW